MSWVAVGTGAVTLAVGVGQHVAAKQKEKKNIKPEYEIPAEIKANMNQAELMAVQGMPEEQQQQYINNIQRSSTSALSQIGSRKGGLAGVAAINQNEIDAYGDLAAESASMQQENQKTLLDQRGIMADYKDQKFQLNKLNPYVETQSEVQALKGAGMNNMAAGLSTAGGGLASMAGGDVVKGKSFDETVDSDIADGKFDADAPDSFNSPKMPWGQHRRDMREARRRDKARMNKPNVGRMGS